MADEIPENISAGDAKKLIDEKVKAAYALITEAQVIADEHKLSFSFDVAYGMGGTYLGNPEDRESAYRYGDYDRDSDDGWRPSSRGC